jgi:hypothetical protein
MQESKNWIAVQEMFTSSDSTFQLWSKKTVAISAGNMNRKETQLF